MLNYVTLFFTLFRSCFYPIILWLCYCPLLYPVPCCKVCNTRSLFLGFCPEIYYTSYMAVPWSIKGALYSLCRYPSISVFLLIYLQPQLENIVPVLLLESLKALKYLLFILIVAPWGGSTVSTYCRVVVLSVLVETPNIT